MTIMNDAVQIGAEICQAVVDVFEQIVSGVEPKGERQLLFA